MSRPDPLSDLLLLQERMNRLFEESLTPGGGEPSLASGAWQPAADLFETATGFILQVDLPGLTVEDITLKVDGNRVSLRGSRRMERGSSPAHFDRVERSYGLFARNFQLGDEVDASQISTRMEDGLLTVELPKRAGSG